MSEVIDEKRKLFPTNDDQKAKNRKSAEEIVMDAISNEMIENEGKIDGELETAIPGNYWSKL